MIRSSSLALALTLTAALGGCASFPHFPHWAKITPIKPAVDHQVAREDGDYAAAAAAIGRRDYAEALERLQAARARKADDVRVLNAFAVVYDKLGRFDLSARYYAQAKTLDPGSPILANNIGYSAAMQAGAAAPPVWQAGASPPSRARASEIASASPPVIRLGFAPQAAAPTIVLAMTGRALEIADASGRHRGAEPVRRRLADLGWSASKAETRSAPREAVTTIRYPARSVAVARALARTLPAGVRLVDCGGACDGVRLVVGADSAGWSGRSRNRSGIRND